MKNKVIKIVKFLFSWPLTIAIFVYIFKKIDFAEFVKTISQMNWKYIIFAGFLISFATLYLGVLKYRYILKILGYDVPFRDVFILRVGGFPLKFVFPLKSGEMWRVYYLNKIAGVEWRKAIYSIVLNWAIRFCLLSLFVVMVFILYKKLFILSLIFLLIVVLFFRFIMGKKDYLFFFLYSFALEIVLIASYYFVFLAANIKIDVKTFYIFIPIILIIEALPVGVGGIGLREISIISIFGSLYDIEKLFSVGLLGSFVNTLIPLLIGMFFVNKFLLETMMIPYDYLKKREKNPFTKYRLNRRMKEIFKTLKSISSNKKIKVLDVGANDGKMMAFLKSKLDNIIDIAGIEPNERYINAKVSDLNIVRAGCENIPFSDGEFDVVILASVVEHIGDIERGISEVKRVLKNNGYMVISFVNPFLDKIASLIGFKPDDHLRRFTKKEMALFLKERGFNIIETKSFGPLFYNLVVAEKKND